MLVSSDKHTPVLWLASYGRILPHTSQLREGRCGPRVLSGPQMKSSLCHTAQVEAPGLSDNLSLNTGQWRGAEDGLEVCRSVRGQNLARALHCKNGCFESVLCNESAVHIVYCLIT